MEEKIKKILFSLQSQDFKTEIEERRLINQLNRLIYQSIKKTGIELSL